MNGSYIGLDCFASWETLCSLAHYERSEVRLMLMLMLMLTLTLMLMLMLMLICERASPLIRRDMRASEPFELSSICEHVSH